MNRKQKITSFLLLPFIFFKTMVVGIFDMEFALILLKKWLTKRRKYNE